MDAPRASSLYDSDHRYRPDAMALDAEVSTVIAPIFSKYLAKGYSPREISHIIMATVSLIEMEQVL